MTTILTIKLQQYTQGNKQQYTQDNYNNTHGQPTKTQLKTSNKTHETI